MTGNVDDPVQPEPKTREDWIVRTMAHGMTRKQAEEFHKDFPPLGSLSGDP